MYLVRFLFSVYVLLSVTLCRGQQDSLTRLDIPVELDSFVVKSGFDPHAFIRRVKQDTTFYKSFKSLHLVNYTAKNTFTALNRAGKVVTTLSNTARQSRNGKCRTTVFTGQQVTGKFFKKNGEHLYFTSDLFYQLFFSETPVCNEKDIVAGGVKPEGTGRMDKTKYELKQLIFNPGAKVEGIPFMGDKASVFDEDELYKYRYRVEQQVLDGDSCFVFSAHPKPEYASKTVFNDLTTWFRKNDFSILARNYDLSYSTLLYRFNVRMRVRTKSIGGKLYPTVIEYDGTWHVFGSKEERMQVNMQLSY